MRLSYRVFVVDGNSVSRLSQRAFQAFFFRGEDALPQYAGQTKQFAIVMYSIEGRKPKKIDRIACQRLRIGDRGEIDESHLMRGIQLSTERGPLGFVRTAGLLGENVVDATPRMKEKAWRYLHPELSGPALKQILDDLFR